MPEQNTLFDHPAIADITYGAAEEDAIVRAHYHTCVIATVEGFRFTGKGNTPDLARQDALAKLEYCEEYAQTVKGNTQL